MPLQNHILVYHGLYIIMMDNYTHVSDCFENISTILKLTDPEESVVCLTDHDCESLIMRRPWPTRGCCAMLEKLI